MAQLSEVDWPTCEQAGCIGIQLAGAQTCLAHCSDEERAAELTLVGETGAIDARGVPVTPALLTQVLTAAPRGENGEPLIKACLFSQSIFSGDAEFGGATFSAAWFGGATFNGDATFKGATFGSDVGFFGATFGGDARFNGATFDGVAGFGGASFRSSAGFGGATFNGGAGFAEAAFNGDATFKGATFGSDAGFYRAIFSGDADFEGATFSGPAWFGTTFTGVAWFYEATFSGDAAFGGAVFNGRAWFHGTTFKGAAWFEEATFSRDATFKRATFSGHASFGATFSGNASFDWAAFSGNAGFEEATFSGDASFYGGTFSSSAAFGGRTFSGDARFDGATFKSNAWFYAATFSGDASFNGATFSGDASFNGATFSGDARFTEVIFKRNAQLIGTRFEQARQFGPVLACRGLLLDSVQFAEPVQIEVSSTGLCCRKSRFPGGVQFRLRWARVVLDDTDLAAPSILAGIPYLSSEELARREEQIAGAWRRLLAGKISARPQLLSLRRADVASLGLSNLSVADCRFAGAHNLDKLRLESDADFATAPLPLRLGKRKWGGREVIAEERAWRASRPRPRLWGAPRWPRWLAMEDEPGVLDPEQIGGLYRALRKGREDAKDEPGAADFYYGEMEMRRHARTTPAAERAIIGLYWLISGYGLRALRSLAALFTVGVLATIMLVGWGLAASTPPQHLSGTVTSSPHNPAQIDATLGTTRTRLPPVSQRWTSQRTRTAMQVALESIVFRSTAQPLTVIGNWITIAARILGPVLLALALLAVRNRVKR